MKFAYQGVHDVIFYYNSTYTCAFPPRPILRSFPANIWFSFPHKKNKSDYFNSFSYFNICISVDFLITGIY
jgi:hypothetical protein